MAFIITKPLADQKQEFIVQIDKLAGEKRLHYITDGAGQEVTYTAKLADAQAYILAGYPTDVTPYHWIDAEATATGNTPTNVADLIVSTAHTWTEVGSKIEGARQAAKIGVNAATTISDIRTIMETYKTALLAIA
jgi:galactitol-specific phosphotransferase system IIB component